MNSEAWVEVEAPTVEEAILLGVTQLGITREQAAVEVVDEGSPGFLGLVGARPARVRVSRAAETQEQPAAPAAAPVSESAGAPSQEPPAQPEAGSKPPIKAEPKGKPAGKPPSRPKRKSKPESKPKPEPKARQQQKPAPTKPKDVEAQPAQSETEDPERRRIEATVLDVGEHLFGELDVEMSITWREEDRRPALWFSLSGSDAGSLVGHKGKTLNAAQFLMRVLVRSKVDGNYNLIVDADGYRWRRYRNLKDLARKTAKKALDLDRPIRMRAMPARERRIVHMTLRSDDRVRTKSYGSGRGRAVTVFPKDKMSK